MRPEPDSALSSLLAALYSGIDGDRPWTYFLKELSRWMDANYAVLIIAKPGTEKPGTFLAPGTNAQRSADYIDSFFADDPFRSLPDGLVTSFADFIAREPVESHRAYRDYLALAGGEQVLAVDLRFAARFEARFRVMRIADRPDFTAKERAKLQALVQHLRIAVALFERLQFAGAQNGVFHNASDGLGLAVLVLDHDRRIVSSNALAERFLAEGEGIRRSGDRISFTASRDSHRIAELLERLPESQGVRRFAILRPENGDLAVTARALDLPAIDAATGALVLFLTRPGTAPTLDEATIASLFGLTPAEARLAALLARGQTLGAAARHAGISSNTAKTQLRAIFAKTDTHRQSQLVGKLLTLAG